MEPGNPSSKIAKDDHWSFPELLFSDSHCYVCPTE
jgi:hypothetical protein